MAAVGRRVLLPPSNTLSSDFLEMRHMGAYPDSAAFTFLFQYIERALEANNRESVQRFQHLLSTVKHEATQSLSELIRVLETTRFVASDQFVNAVRTATDALVRGLGLALNTDYAVVGCFSQLCTKLACRCEIRYLIPFSSTFQMRRKMTEGSFGPLFYLAISTEVFALYTYMQIDNFYLPKCGCLTLKYHFFEDMARLAGQRALTANELSVPCRQCQKPITSEDIELLLRSSHQFTAHGDQMLCKKRTERGFCCLNAGCTKVICTMCGIVRMLTAKGPICVCGLNFLDQVKAVTVSHNFNHLAEYLDVAAKPMNFEYDAKQVELNTRLSRTVVQGPRTPSPEQINVNVPKGSTVLKPLQPKSPAPAAEVVSTVKPNPSEKVNQALASTQKLMGVSLPAKERQPVQPQYRNPGYCTLCQVRIVHSLCSHGCACLPCGYSAAYSKSTLSLSCPLCNEDCAEHFDQKRECSCCKKTVKLKYLEYLCLRCKLVVCARCFQKLKGQLQVCHEGVPHFLEPTKLQADRQVSKSAGLSLFGFTIN